MRIFAIAVSAFVFAGLAFYGCDSSSSGGGSGEAIDPASNEYGGPGSDIRLTLEAEEVGDFTWTKAANIEATESLNFDNSVSGTFETLDSGFLKLTVVESDCDGAVADDIRYAMVVPGFTTVMQPMCGEDGIETALNLVGCPSEDFTANWISPETDSPNNRSRDIWGTFTYDFSELTGTVSGGYNLVDGFEQDDEFGEDSSLTGTCTRGMLRVADDEGGADIYLNPSGGALVDAGTNLIVAMPSGELTAADLDGTYFGLALFSGDRAESTLTGMPEGDVAPVSATVSSSGTAVSITAFEDVDSDSLADAALATFGDLTYNTTNEVNGSIVGTMTIDGQEANVVCLGATDAGGSGKNILYCQTYDPTYADGTEESPGIGIGFLLREE